MPSAKHYTTLADLDGRNFATVGEAAAILEYDARTVRKGIADGDIPAVRADRRRSASRWRGCGGGRRWRRGHG